MSASVSSISNAIGGYAEALFAPVSGSAASDAGQTAGSRGFSATAAISDIISLSVEAMQASAGAAARSTESVSPSQGRAVTPQDIYSTTLTSAFADARGMGTTTITFTGGAGSQPSITGTNAAAFTTIMHGNASSSASVGAMSPAMANFASIYDAQAKAGPAGRFYQGTDLNSLASTMTGGERTSFIAAFNSQTLDIHMASNAPGVKMSGSFATTFSGGPTGSGMASGGDASISTTALMKINQYALVSYDNMFGPTVISWGGPPAASASTTS